MDANLEALAGSLKDLLKGRLESYLSSKKDQKDFLEERTRRLAELTVQLAKSFSDTDQQAEIKRQMAVVSDTIVNELHAAAVDISVEFRRTVQDVLGTALDFAVKVIPKLIPALATI
jgi:cell division septum initiation protein DivIVA